jgi:hypothetical protein
VKCWTIEHHEAKPLIHAERLILLEKLKTDGVSG